MTSSAGAREPRIVIVGAGLAGLFTALKLAPLPVTVVAAKPLGDGASSDWAQGGIAAAMGEGDTWEAHAADTVAVGGGLVVPGIADILAREASDRIHDLLEYGVPFDRDLGGHLTLSREAAHSARRIVHVRGDMAGRQIMQALIAQASAAEHIEIIENFTALEAVTEGGQVAGVVIARSGTSVRADLSTATTLPASAVVLATGGIGRLFAVTTNAADARGEGIGIAARAGATIADAEFVQFHPTAIDVGRDPAPLATEALRGEGAILVNRNGVRFMADIHADAELGPRDVVARAVFAEVASGRGAFLDCRKAIGARMEQAFPTVYGFCVSAGIDPATELIPVAPAAHYHMGGVLTDANGRTSVEGLWACGEAASTGAHGANRLASNSLLEAVVFGARIAEDLRDIGPKRLRLRLPRGCVEAPPVSTAFLTAEETTTLRKTMSEKVGVVRDGEGLAAAAQSLDEIASRLADAGQQSNMLLAAQIVTATALAREESRGGHERGDFPELNTALDRRSYAKIVDGAIELAPLASPVEEAASNG